MSIRIAMICFIALIAQAAYSQIPLHQNIKNSIQSFVSENISTQHDHRLQVDIGHLDKRLRLKPCNMPLHVFVPPGQSYERMSIAGVRCDGVNPWKVFVPVKIKMFAKVVTTRVPLSRKQIIKPQDVVLSDKNIYRLREGYFKNIEEVVGTNSRFSLSAGKILTPRIVTQPTLVKKGMHVVIVMKKNQLDVRMKGIAQKNGALNDQIPVKNLSSNRVIYAIVQGSGVVVVQ